jgi:glutamate synthase (NADPH/NADH) large chain
VAKAGADIITISGAEGGTGASPSSSIKHAGLPVEIGLSETQQTLVMNNLRRNVILQTDGQMKTGLDIVLSAILGAEEYGFSTAALISLGCIMMRKCHLNTCPVGIATQDETLRKKYTGRAEYLVNYFTFMAMEVRELLAEMGFTSLDDIVGRAELLEIKKPSGHWKASKVDVASILHVPDEAKQFERRFTTTKRELPGKVLDLEIIEKCKPALENAEKVNDKFTIHNTDRATGAMLSGRISEMHGLGGLEEDTIQLGFKGSAGQSFGAFLVKGVTFRLEGDANDYLGKGLSGGKIIIVAPKGVKYKPEDNVIIGNTVLYGATGGEIYVNGIAGERFCVRNSGALAVVEGTGDHCCEYMTGGRTVVLGRTGRNFAAGMSGGIAYVLDLEGDFDYYCNMGMVEISLVEDLQDLRELRSLLERHYRYTASTRAKMILEDWETYLPKFLKIIPYEYKRVLEEEKLEALKRKIEQVETDVENQE